MTFDRISFRTYLVLLLLATPSLGYGQTQTAERQTDQSSCEAKASPVASQSSRLQIDVKRSSESRENFGLLKAKMEALEALVDQQRRALAAMQKRLEEMASKERTPGSVAEPASELNKPKAEAGVEGQQSLTSDAPKKNGAGQQAAQEKPASATAGWNGNHAFLRSADGSFETNLAGYAQLDFRGYQSGAHPPNTFLVRRARIALEGRVYRYFEYRIQGDFADTSNTPLRDFYVNIHRFDALQLRFGQTREPFSQEEMRSDSLQDFVERSLVNNLAPSRSPGLMASGVIGKGVFEYQVGAFNGKGLLQNNNNGTPDVALRVRFNPWRGSRSFWAKGLLFGGAYNQGRNINGASVRGQTESRLTFFQPETVNGKLYRANGELTWLLGPATLRAEYDQTNQFRDNLGPRGANLPGVIAKGYMAQFTYVLTGEAKPDAGPVTPKKNFFGEGNAKTGLGAWELKLRYSNLQINDGTLSSNRADTIYFGTNWYMNKFVRYMLDFGIERFKDPARAPKPGDRNFFTVLSRVQIQF